MIEPTNRGIVALGGGHGLYATLSAARRLTPYVTAVVTVADDGGSSGRLRSELDVVPPGDLRMALAALASDSPHGRLWATILQHRFGGSGALAGHPIGNLLLAGLSELLADPVAALDELGRILGVKGRVLPMCPIALQIEADVSGLESDPRMFRLIRGQVAIATTPGRILGVKGRVLPMCPIALQIEADVSGLESDPRMFRLIRGQVAIATTPGKVRRVRLLPDNPPATRQAVDAIMAADLVVLGPGSWFTSVIPHVLVPGLAAALRATTARRALVLNLVAEPGETAGFSVERHLHVLAQHAPDFTVHDIIIDVERVPSEREREQLRRTARLLSAEVHFVDVARPGTPLHDPGKLAAALDGVRAARKASGAPSVTATADIRVDGASPPAGGSEPAGSGPRGDDAWR